LLASKEAPRDMVLVSDAQLSLSLFGYDYTRFIPARSYFIDKYEVTNKQFKAFVDCRRIRETGVLEGAVL
jgi:hypothetical protein